MIEGLHCGAVTEGVEILSWTIGEGSGTLELSGCSSKGTAVLLTSEGVGSIPVSFWKQEVNFFGRTVGVTLFWLTSSKGEVPGTRPRRTSYGGSSRTTTRLDPSFR